VSFTRSVAEVAFRMHEKGILPREELLRILRQCVNSVAIENGYADTHGLPFSKRANRPKK